MVVSFCFFTLIIWCVIVLVESHIYVAGLYVQSLSDFIYITSWSIDFLLARKMYIMFLGSRFVVKTNSAKIRKNWLKGQQNNACFVQSGPMWFRKY